MSRSPSYQPSFHGPIEGYVVNFIKTNLWRVACTLERDDLMQDAYIVFRRIEDTYPGVEAPHFMALFKKAWYNHFTDLANADTRARTCTSITTRNEEGVEVDYEPVGEVDNEGALAVLMRQAPREVTAVLNLFLNAPQELLDIALGSWTGPDRRCRAGGSERINKMLGLPLHLDVLQLVHDHFH